jgi:hypothetical protein
MEIQINLPAMHDIARAGHNVQIDITKLRADTIAQLVLHGLTQKIGDAAAGKKGDDALAAMQQVMDQLIAGNWTVRKAGTAGRDALARMMIAKARPMLKKHVDGYAGMTAAEKDDAIWELIEGLLPAQRDAIERMAQAQLDQDAEAEKTLRGLDLGL